MVCAFTAAKVSLRSGEKIDQEGWTLYLSILPSLLRDSSLLTHHFLSQAIFGLYFPLPWVHAKVQLWLSVPGTSCCFKKRGPRNGFLADFQNSNLLVSAGGFQPWMLIRITCRTPKPSNPCALSSERLFWLVCGVAQALVVLKSFQAK